MTHPFHFTQFHPSSSLNIPSPGLVDPDRVRWAEERGGIQAIVRLFREADAVGDQAAVALLVPAMLGQPGALSLSGWSHTRLFQRHAVSLAGEYPASVSELDDWARRVAEGLDLSQLSLDITATCRVADLEKSRRKAATKVEKLLELCPRVSSGQSGEVSELTRRLVGVGAYPLAEAFLEVALASGDAWPGATAAAQLRRVGQDAKAVAFCEAVLREFPTFAPAMNPACGALVTMGHAREAIARFLLPSLAYGPVTFRPGQGTWRSYVGNTGRRAFREAGNPAQENRCNHLSVVAANADSGPWGDVELHCQALAAEILAAEGAHDLATMAFGSVRRTTVASGSQTQRLTLVSDLSSVVARRAVQEV